MFHLPFSPPQTHVALAPRWADVGPAWQIALIALALAVPVALVLWLSAYEHRLVRRPQAIGLLALRLTSILILWALVAFQPVLTHISTDVPPSRVRVAVDTSSSMDVADDGSVVRKEIARRILAPDGLRLVERLQGRHAVEVIAFDEARRELDAVAPGQMPPDPAGPTRATDLRQALRLGDTSGGGPLAGLILLTDGRHTVGPPPVALAKEWAAAGVPIYPVLIGPKRPPPDLLVVDVKAPAKVFRGTTIPVAVRVRATQMPAQELTVELRVDGQPARPEWRRTLRHDGKDQTYAVEFPLPADVAGTQVIRVETAGRDANAKEVTLANNRRSTAVRVAEDKARVLLVDAEARWEYQYLAAALARDPVVQLERVLLAAPRLGLVADADRDKAGLPKPALPAPGGDGKDPLPDFDCVILGDVSPEQLPPADRRRLERYVADRGGTLVVVAGKRALPLEYITQPGAETDPLVKLLPIRAPRVRSEKPGFSLRPTDEGKRTPFLQLGEEGEAPSWPELPKHYWGVVGERRPGATVLAVAGDVSGVVDDRTPGVIVMQSYGFGKVLFVGVDSTWRWRYKTGDAVHHRFWGQVVRWSAAEKLLPGGNRFVRFGTREPVYPEGQEVELAVRLGDDAKSPPASVRARVVRDGTGGETVAVVPLTASARRANAFDGRLRDLRPGKYRVELDGPELAKTLASEPAASAPFEVLPAENGELLDLSADENLLRRLADETGGRLFTTDDVEQVLDALARKLQPRQERHDTKPWQDEPLVWWVLGVLAGLLCVEWAWRKRLDLP
jgi:hypothetical protein